MNDLAEAAVVEKAEPYTLLCVDDEANILSALRRLLRPHGYRVLTAEGGAAGLTVLAETPADLVISDMRMPGMDGAQFLEQVRARWPDTVRVLLTGYADINSTIAAVNQGQIYRYVSKPWDDAEIVRMVKEALERKALEREKARLEKLTAQQNQQLSELNATLEARVHARTAELGATLRALEGANDKLKKGFLTSIRVFSNLIELREGATTGRSRQVADLARRLALHLKLDDAAVQDVTLAALLRDIGKFGLADVLLRKPFSALTNDERAEFVKHPLKAQAALIALEQLNGAARLIRHHRERFDGKGYPDGLSGLAIPPGARIVALAADYEAAQHGGLLEKCLTQAQAREYLVEGRGLRYDPVVVDAFITISGAAPDSAASAQQMMVTTASLTPGMVLACDLVTQDGIMLLSKDYPIDATLIEQIRNYEKSDGRHIKVCVKAPNRR